MSCDYLTHLCGDRCVAISDCMKSLIIIVHNMDVVYLWQEDVSSTCCLGRSSRTRDLKLESEDVSTYLYCVYLFIILNTSFQWGLSIRD